MSVIRPAFSAARARARVRFPRCPLRPSLAGPGTALRDGDERTARRSVYTRRTGCPAPRKMHDLTVDAFFSFFFFLYFAFPSQRAAGVELGNNRVVHHYEDGGYGRRHSAAPRDNQEGGAWEATPEAIRPPGVCSEMPKGQPNHGREMCRPGDEQAASGQSGRYTALSRRLG